MCMKEALLKPKEIDQEWIQLILEAKEIGLTPDQIRLFLLGSTAPSGSTT